MAGTIEVKFTHREGGLCRDFNSSRLPADRRRHNAPVTGIGIRPSTNDNCDDRGTSWEVDSQSRHGAFALRHECARRQLASLTLTGISRNSIIFADRPVRAAGHLLTEHLLEEWSVGSFAKDPPNATVSVLSKDGAAVRDAVVELKIPHLEGDRLTFDVRLLEGDLTGADGPASVFVDIIGLPFTPLSFAGVARRTARRAYWYGAAAAAAAPYYPPYGYPPPYYPYPYPPPY